MKLQFSLRFLIFGLAALVVITSMTAVAATNTIPSTRIGAQIVSFNINHLKPSVCAGFSVTTLVTGSVTLTGTEGNDLILGSSGADTIDGLGGNDCILGGGGDDSITGGDGNDVCLGGAGTDTFTECETEIQ
jgi:Ca2+-binding RTX toxin-like protein